MYIHRFISVRLERFHNTRTNRDVRHIVPVHHIHMDPVRTGIINRANLLAKFGKVSG